jgi:hypothetical protein
MEGFPGTGFEPGDHFGERAGDSTYLFYRETVVS